MIEKLKEDALGSFCLCEEMHEKMHEELGVHALIAAFPLWLLASGDMQLRSDICRRLEAEMVDFTILRYWAIWRLNGELGLCLGWTPASWNLRQEMVKHTYGCGNLSLPKFPTCKLMSYTKLYWFGWRMLLHAFATCCAIPWESWQPVIIRHVYSDPQNCLPSLTVRAFYVSPAATSRGANCKLVGPLPFQQVLHFFDSK